MSKRTKRIKKTIKKMNKEQRKILENRKKELKVGMIPFIFFLIGGIFLSLTILLLPIGFILTLIGYLGINSRKKQINDIEFRLAE